MTILDDLEHILTVRESIESSLESDMYDLNTFTSIFDIGIEGELYNSFEELELQVESENKNKSTDFLKFTNFGIESVMEKIKSSPDAIKRFMKRLFEIIKRFFIASMDKIRWFLNYTKDFFKNLMAKYNKNNTEQRSNSKEIETGNIEFYRLQPVFKKQYLALKNTANLIGDLNRDLNKGSSITEVTSLFTKLVIINIGVSLQIDVTESRNLNGLTPDMDYSTLKSKMDEFIPFFTKTLEGEKAVKVTDGYEELNTDIMSTHNIISSTEKLIQNMEKVLKDLHTKVKSTVSGIMSFIDTYMEDINTDKEASTRNTIKSSHGITLEELGQIRDHLQLLTILDTKKNTLYKVKHEINKENLKHLEDNIETLRNDNVKELRVSNNITGALSYKDDTKFLEVVKSNDVFAIKSDLEGMIATFKGNKVKIDEAIQYAIDNSDFDWEVDNGSKPPQKFNTTRELYNYEKGTLVQNFSKERYERVLKLYKEHRMDESNKNTIKERDFKGLKHFMNAVKNNDVFAIKSDLQGMVEFYKGNKVKIDEAVKYAIDNSDFDFEKDDGVYFGENSKSVKEKYFYESGRLVQNFTKERYNRVIELYKRYTAVADTEDGVK